jgi:hypothetical protein
MRSHQKESTIEAERLNNEIVTAAFRHDGDKRVRQHFHNARRLANTWGIYFRKEHRMSARKIDAVPATMLARMARRALGPRTKRTKRAVFV